MNVYKREGSSKWWGQFRFKGHRYQIPTGIENDGTKKSEKAAMQMLAGEHAKYLRAEKGIVDPKEQPQAEPQTVGQLLDNLQEDYQERGIDTTENLSLFALVKEAFGTRMSNVITDQTLKDYRKDMRQDGYADSTIRNRLQVLIQAFELAKVPAPVMPDLKAATVREGFFNDLEIDTLLKWLPDDDLRDFVHFGYIIGWRLNAISTLTWNDVEEDTIRLRSKNSKNDRPYHIPFDIHPELAAIMERRRKARSIKTDKGVVLSQWVFHRDGDPICEFRKAWHTACIAIGLGKMICRVCGHQGAEKRHCGRACQYHGRIFHDLRRSAARNLIRAGVPTKVAMKITGHETDSMLWRYDITDDADLREAMVKIATRRKSEQQKIKAMRGV